MHSRLLHSLIFIASSISWINHFTFKIDGSTEAIPTWSVQLGFHVQESCKFLIH